MGCWGITASESDAGLDALAAIRTQIQKDGTLKLEDILAELKRDAWNAPVDVLQSWTLGKPIRKTKDFPAFLLLRVKKLPYSGCGTI